MVKAVALGAGAAVAAGAAGAAVTGLGATFMEAVAIAGPVEAAAVSVPSLTALGPPIWEGCNTGSHANSGVNFEGAVGKASAKRFVPPLIRVGWN